MKAICMKSLRHVLIIIGLMLGFAQNAIAFDTRAIAIEHVNIITMATQNTVLKDATVLIEKDRIVAINGPIPKNARRINGKGKWLIPGLSDMHVHIPSDGSPGPKAYPTQGPMMHFDTQDIMTPFIANGVTQILNMDAVPASVGQRNSVESGVVIGPHMALASVINGGNSKNGFIANTPNDARQAVRDARGQGYDFIKVYSDLKMDTFLAIVDEAKIEGLKTLGHIPESFEGHLDSAFVPNFTMVAHAEEFSKQSEQFTDEDAKRFAKLAKANGTWVTPTLIVMKWIANETRTLDDVKALPTLKYMHPILQEKWIKRNRYNKNSSPKLIAYFERMVEFHRRLIKAFKAEGVLMMSGSDCLTSGVVPGYTLHDELELLVDAGLTPEEALASSTRLPAQWLGTDVDRGTIEVGKRADMVLLDANPLDKISNTRKISGVMINGRWLDRVQLDKMLSTLVDHNEQLKAQMAPKP